MSAAPKINFLSPVAATEPRWRRRRIARGLVVAAVLTVAALFSATAAAPGERFAPIIAELAPPVLVRGLGRLFLSSDRLLDGEAEDRVNVLLLGVGGEGHDGPELTDTIILLSYKPSTKQVALLSIPRDLVADIPGYGWRKVNAVNAYAEANAPGTGAGKTAAFLDDLLGVRIPYYVRVDFAGFEKVIDELGGVLVYVDRPFTDASYPAPQDEYRTVSFKGGWQRMDGETALIFARSRHGNNFEGSDFARSGRQQKILLAAKEELLSAGTLANPTRLSRIFEIVSGHVATNLGPWELLRFSAIAKEADAGAIVRKTLDPESGGPLVPGNVNGAYVLVPASGTYDGVRAIARDVFAAPTGTENVPPSSAPSRTVRVEIQNGTTLTGFASKAATEIRAKGYGVSFVGNAPSRGYERTVIYDLSGGKYGTEIATLRNYLDADVSVTIPEWFSSSALPPALTANPPSPQGGASSADFLVILGQSSARALNAI